MYPKHIVAVYMRLRPYTFTFVNPGYRIFIIKAGVQNVKAYVSQILGLKVVATDIIWKCYKTELFF